MKVRLLRDIDLEDSRGRFVRIMYKAGDVVEARYDFTGRVILIKKPNGYDKSLLKDYVEIIEDDTEENDLKTNSKI